MPSNPEHRQTYFVTWRVRRGAPPLGDDERDCVFSALNHFNAVRYDLHAAVVMDDHVHVLFTLLADHTLSKVLHSWKSFTAHELRKRGRDGHVWQDESFDRCIFSRRELEQKARYIEMNPTKRWADAGGYRWVQCSVTFTAVS